ncbi:hypothetical protein CC78DRAFT_565240 [Lojkania enalia]|uniref:DUF6594 domain-containing protein n=1 Tax=Lojkania enalia TaxID=147567 RepID=A0A9P4N989_9PLEO|nr:hypothetical protein CC78DRAFT_565240 [Didymosphaeria enalia]
MAPHIEKDNHESPISTRTSMDDDRISSIHTTSSMSSAEEDKITPIIHCTSRYSTDSPGLDHTPIPTNTFSKIENLKGKPASTFRVAKHITESRDEQTTILRRFDRVNLRNLLVMQDEIAGLEEEIEKLCDEQCDDYWLKEEKVGRGHRIEELDRELREKIRQYYDAILITMNIQSLARPSLRNLYTTRQIMRKYGGGHLAKKEFESDLSALSWKKDDDLLTKLFEGQFASIFQDTSSNYPSPRRIAFAVTFVSTICIAIFLVGAVVGLYFVSSIRKRLGMLGCFTVLFAATIAMLTNARRQDVFVATAAYAAVLVVFVSGNIAADPIPTTCIFQNTNTGAGAAILNTVAPINSLGSLSTANFVATVMATPIATITYTQTVPQSAVTIVSTVISQITATPTIIIKKGELSTFAKTGIGVGASVGALFCLMVIGCGAVPCLWRGWKKGIWRFGSGGRHSIAVSGRPRRFSSWKGRGSKAGNGPSWRVNPRRDNEEVIEKPEKAKDLKWEQDLPNEANGNW